jgi:hypothetical protein
VAAARFFDLDQSEKARRVSFMSACRSRLGNMKRDDWLHLTRVERRLDSRRSLSAVREVVRPLWPGTLALPWQGENACDKSSLAVK